MAVYKDKKRGTWYVSLYYTDWTGKQQRKLKRIIPASVVFPSPGGP